MNPNYTSISNILSAKLDFVRVKQENSERIIKCSGVLFSQTGRLDIVQVGLVGKPFILAEISSSTVDAEEVAVHFVASFSVQVSQAIPKEFFVFAHSENGAFSSCIVSIPQNLVEFDGIVDCSDLVVEAVARRQEIEYRAFVERGTVLNFPFVAQPEISIVVTQGSSAQIYSAIRSLEHRLLARGELYLPEDNNTEELLANLKGVHGYKIAESFSESIRQVLSVSRAKYIMFLDPKANVLDGAFDTACSVFDKSKNIVAVVGRVLRPDGFLYEAGRSITENGDTVLLGSGQQANAWEFLYEHEVDLASPVLSFFRKECLEDIYSDLGAIDFNRAFTALSNTLNHIGKIIVYHPDILSTLSVDKMQLTVEHTDQQVVKLVEEDLLDKQTQILTQVDEISEHAPVVCSVFPKCDTVCKAGILVVIGNLTEDIVVEGRLHDIFDSLVSDNISVTIYAMRGISCSISQLRRDLPATVQYVDGTETPLSKIIDHNKGAFSVAIVWQLPHLRKVLDTLRPYGLPVICDVSGREVFSEPERALMSKAVTIWVKNKKEALRLADMGIHHSEIMPFSGESIESSYLASILPNMFFCNSSHPREAEHF